MPRKYYPAVIYSDEARENFGVTFVDLPVNAGGASVESALLDAELVFQEVVDDLIAEGEKIPEPSNPANIPEDIREGSIAVSLVPVNLKGKSQRISVTLDEELIQRIDAVASNRSAFLAASALEALRKSPQ